MKKIHTVLGSINNKAELNYLSLALLSSSSVLRNEKEFKEILSAVKVYRINKKKIYEALLQTYLFAGYPSALISLSIFSEYFDTRGLLDEKWNFNLFKTRGEKNCRRIYGNKFDKLINNIKSFSPSLSDWLVTEGYGKVLGRKNLSLKEREVCNIAVLSALEFENQLYSHINGGHRLGLTWVEIGKIIDSLYLLNRKDSAEFGKRILLSVKRRKEE
jgi:alkylhydroperoxidase/carboxymuconolactone decarboxylase family protein YurZ